MKYTEPTTDLRQISSSEKRAGGRYLRLVLSAVIFVASSVGAFAGILNSQEQNIADRMVRDPGQKRTTMKLDPILASVARARATDMATRNYFGHVNPDGFGPNYLVRKAGYKLPDWWGTAPEDNFIESIAAGQITGLTPEETAWQNWMNSTPHRTHILGLDAFNAEQTSYGVGYAYNPNSTYKYYFVIITAPPDPTTPSNTTPANAALFLSQNVPATMTARQTYRVSVEMLNSGTKTWNEANQIRLGSQAPAGNTTWGLSRVPMPRDVAPGTSIVLSFDVTAPAGPGVYDFQWQMFADRGSAFGEQSLRTAVAVVADFAAPVFPPVGNVPAGRGRAASPTPAARPQGSASGSSSQRTRGAQQVVPLPASGRRAGRGS